jgi:uncharacterized damage-inducible protein DinB
MKSVSVLAAASLLVCGWALTGAAQGQKPAPNITTLAGDVQADWAGVKELFTNAADAMPEDKFSFKSTPAQRSFGEHVMHVVEVNGFILETLGGKTPPPTINMKATSKADVMAALRQSFAHGDAVVKDFTDQQWNGRVTPPPFMGPSASRLRLVYLSLQHTQDTYGQMVVYLRLNGIVPPASRGGV